jgi:hypothetical protein
MTNETCAVIARLRDLAVGPDGGRHLEALCAAEHALLDCAKALEKVKAQGRLALGCVPGHSAECPSCAARAALNALGRVRL